MLSEINIEYIYIYVKTRGGKDRIYYQYWGCVHEIFTLKQERVGQRLAERILCVKRLDT